MDDAVAIDVSGFSPEGLAKIGPAMQSAVDQGLLSGVVTLLWRHGQLAQVTTSGLRDIERKLPMQRDTLFRVASMTKPVTSVAALMLMEEGKLALSDPITKWAPEFSNMRVLKDPKGPLDETYPSPRDITVEDLMTHRSGLAYGFTSEGPIGKAHEKALGHPIDSVNTPDEWMAALGALPLSYPPGDRFHYSHSTDLLGFLVGRIAGTTFRDFLMTRIFKPLGMVDTDFWTPPEKLDRLAVVYSLEGDPLALKPAKFKRHDAPPAYTGGGGGLYSTADDYLAFARLFVGEGEVDRVRLLKPETIALMTTNRLTDAQRAIPFMNLPLWSGQGFGLGVSVVTDAQKQAWTGPSTNGSLGWGGAYGTWWRADPAEDMIMIYLIQNTVPADPGAGGQFAAGQRLAAQGVLVQFQSLTYQALGRPA